MGHSISMLTAALLVGQVGQTVPAGKDCSCQKGVNGRVFAQPAVSAEGSRLAPWRNASGGSWIDNRPVLSRIRNFFRDDDDQMTIVGQPDIVQPVQTAQPERNRLFRNASRSSGTTYPSPLPTFVEPRIGEPVGAPRAVPPAEVRPAPAGQDLPKITVEPINFRASGASGASGAKGQASKQSPTSEERTPSAADEPGVLADRLVTSTTTPRNYGAIQERFVNKIGQPGDYSWITGQLEIRGNTYILHYATPDTIDRFGGSIVVQPQGELQGVRNGDLVSAHGTVVQERGRPVYRTKSIDFIER